MVVLEDTQIPLKNKKTRGATTWAILLSLGKEETGHKTQTRPICTTAKSSGVLWWQSLAAPLPASWSRVWF